MSLFKSKPKAAPTLIDTLAEKAGQLAVTADQEAVAARQYSEWATASANTSATATAHAAAVATAINTLTKAGVTL